jgi:hypothetical protein
MVEPKNGKNWENFLVNYFQHHNMSIEKRTDSQGFIFQCEKKGLYISFQLDESKAQIKKIEFGRSADGYVKGLIVRDKKLFVTFVQETIEGEEGSKYRLDYTVENLNLVAKALTIPLEIGWTEKEYKLKHGLCYKVVITCLNKSWEIDIRPRTNYPVPGDSLDIWMTSMINDMFWNKSNRQVREFTVIPIFASTSR